MSQFIENLVRPHVLDTTLDDGYRAMAANKDREAEALEWCNTLAGDIALECPGEASSFSVYCRHYYNPPQ